MSKRAKYIRLVMDAQGKLEVVLPYGVPKQQAKQVVENQQAWIRKKQSELPQKISCSIPEMIVFPSLNQRIAVQQEKKGVCGWQQQSDVLIVSYNEPSDASLALQDWLKHEARRHLPAMLEKLAQEMDEQVCSVRVKLQKTRWGSCSAKRNINLNAKLLLLPEPLLRSVLVHELAHLQHLNHSPAFWQRVSHFDPNYREHRQALRAWERQSPGWVNAK